MKFGNAQSDIEDALVVNIKKICEIFEKDGILGNERWIIKGELGEQDIELYHEPINTPHYLKVNEWIIRINAVEDEYTYEDKDAQEEAVKLSIEEWINNAEIEIGEDEDE